uniref:AlNc14C189G8415 protein n=1 Tax=Albugo laibachii Nc14 TaxID=890382 RepID=F0WPS3_9STRA|nr:AlNc14C189G8415 [Albugo laibachii Nc14]CCA24340.1 AlNc14C235G9358 [Albugo laibachii Nc14]|eukprot:CCA24340.1 AlNc14C235G9358 [Albugo laibachii Nc14]
MGLLADEVTFDGLRFLLFLNNNKNRLGTHIQAELVFRVCTLCTKNYTGTYFLILSFVPNVSQVQLVLSMNTGTLRGTLPFNEGNGTFDGILAVATCRKCDSKQLRTQYIRFWNDCIRAESTSVFPEVIPSLTACVYTHLPARSLRGVYEDEG